MHFSVEVQIVQRTCASLVRSDLAGPIPRKTQSITAPTGPATAGRVCVCPDCKVEEDIDFASKTP